MQKELTVHSVDEATTRQRHYVVDEKIIAAVSTRTGCYGLANRI